MVNGKTLQIINDAIKTRGSIHLYTFFIMLHKFSEDSCIQWLQHATVEHRLTVVQTIRVICCVYICHETYIWTDKQWDRVILGWISAAKDPLHQQCNKWKMVTNILEETAILTLYHSTWHHIPKGITLQLSEQLHNQTNSF